MGSAGFDRRTGKVLRDWDHTRQSIEIILTTPKYTRVMRRLFGADLQSLIDAPMNPRVILAAFVAIAEALEPREVEGFQLGEPRFRLVSVKVADAQQDGRITFELTGTYFPNGHLGDFTTGNERVASVSV
ncbi:MULTISPECIES: GPW/gp25 family protein [unclassified Chelatococcus]|uniref:GPW/gp25 family protein n=1 Tax=unclassified Chelatococcus TaxID=2638111 RepID=UPI001BCE2E5D|nr:MULTISPECIES: GPW/gp25 family protein [unclassified Chelatococcus]MBS7737783.1 GPW/gp25 family protein [Chelatococcus sp. HY11]MCO5079239.1 GPW/gp25 family protein [Chelatococcus sp.]CAH1665857.1 GPW/gp25 [Hyphomicrobiales bacterium]CAH1681060.1 GPW/gp25 [Hyphomicrobiales bacterium]